MPYDQYKTRVEYTVYPDTVPHDPSAPCMRDIRRAEFLARDGVVHVLVHQKNTPAPGSCGVMEKEISL